MARPVSLRAAAAAALTMLLAGSTALAAKPRAYLAWHAPYGQPRATDTLMIRPGSGAADTLFLTFDVPADTNQFCGIESELLFRAPAGDTLADTWFDEEAFQVQFATDSVVGCTRPWRGVQLMSFAYYDLSLASGRLRLTNLRPPQRPVRVQAGVPYFYARVIFQHPAATVPRADQPVCFEWSKAQFLMDTTAASSVMAVGGRPYVSWNSRSGEVCVPFQPTPPPVAAEPAKPSRKKPTRKK